MPSLTVESEPLRELPPRPLVRSRGESADLPLPATLHGLVDAPASSLWADLAALTRPRIGALVLVTVAGSAAVAGWGPPHPLLLLHTLLGTALVAASASALNQWLERDSDRRMPRTADRPLPAGRWTSRQVLALGWLLIVAGSLYLALAVNFHTALVALATWGCYVWLYTPLKRRTLANTWVGALAGALPVLIGWTAVGAPPDLRACSLLLMLYLWQFPHFMAIAWLYRAQYAQAGLQMLPVVDPSGLRAGALAVVSALALIPVSLVPALASFQDGRLLVYFAWALALGAGQLGCAVLFLLRLDDQAARRLLRASLIYLPALWALLAMGALD